MDKINNDIHWTVIAAKMLKDPEQFNADCKAIEDIPIKVALRAQAHQQVILMCQDAISCFEQVTDIPKEYNDYNIEVIKEIIELIRKNTYYHKPFDTIRLKSIDDKIDNYLKENYKEPTEEDKAILEDYFKNTFGFSVNDITEQDNETTQESKDGE